MNESRTTLEQDARPPAHMNPVLDEVAALHAREVAPREAALRHRLASERDYLDQDGRLHPEIIEARREIMRA